MAPSVSLLSTALQKQSKREKALIIPETALAEELGRKWYHSERGSVSTLLDFADWSDTNNLDN